MLLMISQPMAGKTNEQIKKERQEVELLLKQQGHEVMDTIIDNVPEDKDTPLYYLIKSLEFLMDADGVVFMEGWKDARGCRIEHEAAKSYGKFIMYL